MDLIEFDDGDENSPLATEADPVDLSCESDNDEPEVNPAALAEAAKNRSRREIFNSFLSGDSLNDQSGAGDDNDDALRRTQKESAKIIDSARDYQQELFERAKAGNIIAVLGTGTGKTLIACLLMRHVAQQETIDRANGLSHRVAFFLVNSVHLVRQQAAVLANNLPSPPKALHGSGKDDLWKLIPWQQIFAEHSAVVCTAAILDQCLSHSYLTIDQISLIVFDEAHHAKKGHPYARIILDYYMKANKNSRRPKIFGMTASPIDSKGDLQIAADTLEHLLHSHIATTSDMSLLVHAPKPRNELWEYEQLLPPFPTMLCKKISEVCKVGELRKYFQFASYAHSQLGSWVADQLWHHLFCSEEEVAKLVKMFELSKEYLDLESMEDREKAMRSIHDAAEIVRSHRFETPIPTSSHLSSKVLILYAQLSNRHSKHSEARTIVFVEQRLSASLLSDCFRRLNIPDLRPSTLQGVSSSGLVVGAESSLRHQEVVMEHFRAGLVNCVFSTSVAEEGIDIPQCNLVVRFDLFKTPIQYMQSRGRARMKDSTYAMMVEQGNVQHQDTIDYAVASEDYINEFCQSLPPDRLLNAPTSKITQMIAREASKMSFETRSGAICSFGNSKVILARYASSLKNAGSFNSQISYELFITDSMFRYKVRLPQDAGIWGARGDLYPNKSLARSSAAWNACRLLRGLNLLDENLDSVHVKQRPENANARLAVSQKKDEYSMKAKPDFWKIDLGSIPVHFYATVLSLIPAKPLQRAYDPLVFFTRSPIPSIPRFNVFLEDDIKTEVVFEAIEAPVPVTSQQVQLLTAFTLNGIFADVFNKSYTPDASRMSYWLAPARKKSHGKVSSDFEEVADVTMLTSLGKGRTTWKPGMDSNLWHEKFLVDPFSGKYHYFTKKVIPGLTIESPPPDCAKGVSDKGKESVWDFTDSHWRSTKKRQLHSRDPDQPIFWADLIMTRRNFLDVSNGKASAIPCHICPQPLQVSALAPSVAATCLIWPSIIHRLESYLIVLEAFQILDLEVRTDLALEAFTKDGNTEDEVQQMHTGNLRGMGKNYERLEFIGDSLLKMTTTIMVYVRYPQSDELGFHCRRMDMLCNLNLFNVATGPLELFKYARTRSFDRSTWYPEGLILLKGRGAKKEPEAVKHPEVSHALGQKTIADISEAIIGAALLTSRDQVNKFDLAIKAVTKVVDSEDHRIMKWSDIPPLYNPPEWSLLTNDPIANDLAVRVQKITGYKFKHPRLLRSAFTHPSDMHGTVPDYQRMEFLGDSVLDLVCINWMFEAYPDRNPQWLTEHKMAMVSNKFLAALAVTLDFDKFIFSTTTSLLGQMSHYARTVRDLWGLQGENKENISRDFWVEIESPPKALSDLVESYIGAVLVDSNFNYAEIEKFFEKFVLWFFTPLELYDTFANRHPTSYVNHKLTDEYHCTEFKVMCSEPQTDPATLEISITAGVLIHNQVVAHDKGTSAKYAKVRVSNKCLDLLEGLSREDFKKQFNCNCR